MLRRSLLTTLLAGGVSALAVSSPVKADDLTGSVYLLLPSTTTVRFTKFDEPNIRAALAKYAPGMTLEVLNANGKAADQVAQMDAALSAGAKGIILVSVDPSQSGGLLEKAAQDNVPVVTFAHDPGPGKVAYHVTVDLQQIGAAQAQTMVDSLPEKRPQNIALMLGDPKYKFYHDQMAGFHSVVDPLIASGDIKIVCEADALDFVPANAQKNMEQCLTKQNNDVDGAFVMNDDTGGGVIAATTQQGIRDQVKLYGGYDATLEAIQRVLAGWQAATMAPPYKEMADSSAQLLVAAMTGNAPPEGLVNGAWKNAFTDEDVPMRADPNTLITADNVQQTVIDAGLFTKEEVCQGIAVDSAFCSGN